MSPVSFEVSRGKSHLRLGRVLPILRTGKRGRELPPVSPQLPSAPSRLFSVAGTAVWVMC